MPRSSESDFTDGYLDTAHFYGTDYNDRHAFAECCNFYDLCDRFILCDGVDLLECPDGQAYAAGESFYLARNGLDGAFSQSVWPREEALQMLAASRAFGPTTYERVERYRG
jgi:hypothetical protein